MRRDVAQWLLRFGAGSSVVDRLSAASERRAVRLESFWRWSVWLGTAVAVESKLMNARLVLPR